MKVNKISPASGTAITLGDSGDTFTIPSGVTLSGAGTSLTALNATQLTSGTVPTARLGSGTANSSVHLRGDGTWAAAVDLTADQSWTGSQRATMVTDNDGSFNMNDGNNFKCTTGGNIQLAFTNNTSGQSGFIILINSSNHTITKASSVKADANLLGTCSVSGTYVISYISDGSSIFLTNSAALT